MDPNNQRITGLRVHDDTKASAGYTLFTPAAGTTAYLVDMEGREVHRWEMEHQPGNWGYLLENGNLLYAGNLRKAPAGLVGGNGGELLEVDWDGNVVWRYEDHMLHHDFSRMPNGNTMALGWEPVPEALAARVQGGVPNDEPGHTLWCDYFNEITPEGKVVWEWHAQEHLDPVEDSICPLHARHEWTHANTCNVLPDGNLLTSFRVTNTIGIIDHDSGEWAWKYRNIELGHQHDPTLLDNGNILVFANGMHVLENPCSKIFEIDPKTNEIVWQYRSKPIWEFFSHFISGAQRLPNGNTLICEGMTGRLFEVTMDGETVWEYVVPFFADHPRHGNTNNTFRARRYAPDFPGLVGRDLSPKG